MLKDIQRVLLLLALTACYDSSQKVAVPDALPKDAEVNVNPSPAAMPLPASPSPSVSESNAQVLPNPEMPAAMPAPTVDPIPAPMPVPAPVPAPIPTPEPCKAEAGRLTTVRTVTDSVSVIGQAQTLRFELGVSGCNAPSFFTLTNQAISFDMVIGISAGLDLNVDYEVLDATGTKSLATGTMLNHEGSDIFGKPMDYFYWMTKNLTIKAPSEKVIFLVKFGAVDFNAGMDTQVEAYLKAGDSDPATFKLKVTN